MSIVRCLWQAEDGAAVIETAFALPILLVMIWGIFQFGIAMNGNAGMQHALGEGARLATLCYNPTPETGCDNPSDAEIVAKVSGARFGTNYGTFGTPTIKNGVPGTNSKVITVSFTMPLNFLLFQGPTVTMTKSKTVYLAD